MNERNLLEDSRKGNKVSQVNSAPQVVHRNFLIDNLQREVRNRIVKFNKNDKIQDIYRSY